MRLVITDDNGTNHDVHEDVDLIDWYDSAEVQELVQNLRHTIDILKEAPSDE